MNNVIESQISQYISGKLIKNRIILSEAFNMRCEKISLDNIDSVIDLIRASKNPDVAKEGLMNSFNLSEKQAQAILEMRLQRQTGLEIEKVLEEFEGKNFALERKTFVEEEKSFVPIPIQVA